MIFQTQSVAENEGNDAAAWYDDQQAGLGEDFLAQVQRSYATIRHNPIGFPRLEYYLGGLEVRRCLMHRFPYAVIYVCRPDEIVVVAIAHTRRKPLYWLDRLN